ncbi:MAG: SPOR domain-containing protein, partial [Sulfuricella sp.]|nr:SPOR domain-containing protein [Sulfuricella sp.]
PAKAEEPAKAPAAASAEPAPAVKEPASQPKHMDEKSAAASKQESVPFVIQLGAFANLANAKERQSRLTALKVKFYTETVKTPSGDKLRVRAGPYATRQEAERVQAKLKAAGIQDGVVAEKK